MEVDEPQVGQRREDIERQRGYYHLIISLKGLEIFHQERRGQVNTVVMEKLQENSRTQVRIC